MNYKICFVSPGLYPLLQEKSKDQVIGGSELQQMLLGVSLKKEGHEVSFVTCAWGGETEDEVLNGFKVFKSYALGSGLPFLRLVFPRFFKIWKAMKRAEADVYYQRGGYYLTAMVALFCRVNRKVFIFSGAHDKNFLKIKFNWTKISGLKSFVRQKIFMWGVRNSSHVLAQSSRQRECLKRSGVESSVAYNFYPKRELTGDEKSVLWVGTIKSFKRPLLFLEIAKRFPANQFIMVGGRSKKEPDLYDKIVDGASKIGNLQFLGFRPWEETEKIFDRASLYINTSEMEGFPNTFLQAWARGIPVISFLDIDNLIKKHRLGSVVTSIDEIKNSFNELLNLSIEERERIINYCTSKHSPETYIKSINDAIGNLYNKSNNVTQKDYKISM